jgi:hypothetical protein
MNEDIKYEVLWLNKDDKLVKNAIFFDYAVALGFYADKLEMGRMPQLKKHETITTILQCTINKINDEKI